MDVVVHKNKIQSNEEESGGGKEERSPTEGDLGRDEEKVMERINKSVEDSERRCT